MTQRITNSHLDAKVDIINRLLGHEDASWNVVGSVQLYQAYGATGVNRVMNTSGGVTTLAPIGTKREASIFLDGILTALRFEVSA